MLTRSDRSKTERQALANRSDAVLPVEELCTLPCMGSEMHNRKQLYVLLATAAWVSFVFLRFYGDYRPGDPTIETTVGALVFGAIAYSLPPLLLSAILFWWFGKDK